MTPDPTTPANAPEATPAIPADGTTAGNPDIAPTPATPADGTTAGNPDIAPTTANSADGTPAGTSTTTPSRDEHAQPAAARVHSEEGGGDGRPDPALAGKIVVEHVTFAYQIGDLDTPNAQEHVGEPSLIDISYSLEPGTITLLTGASGSGKSSALRLLNGLIPHFHKGKLEGSVTCSGVDVPKAELWQSGLTSATVFQNPRTQFFTTNVDDELSFSGQNYGVAPEVIIERMEEATAMVGIETLRGRALQRLSGGELQKVAAAQAIAAHTDILLFDEPTSNLSPSAIDAFATLLGQLKAQGKTIVIAEHRLHFLRGLIDEALVCSEGKIVRRFTGNSFFAMSEEERQGLGLRALHVGNHASPAIDQDAPGLTITDLEFAYGNDTVLAIPKLTFPRGKVSVLAGENGVGKSTLARIICGLRKAPGTARLTLDGVQCKANARIAQSYIVMQDVHRQLFSESVESEVVLGLTADEQAQVNATQLLEEFDLAGFEERHPMSLSGGQKQRLVIASAMACSKEVYVFDEPTSGVDWRHLQAIAQRLQHLASTGAVVIVITHDQELIDICADQVVTLHRVGPDCPSSLGLSSP